MSDALGPDPRSLDPAAVDGCAQTLAPLLRQVGARHGDGAALAEGAGCIKAAMAILGTIYGHAVMRDTATWLAERAAVPLGPEARVLFALADDGQELPEPRTIDESAQHIARALQTVAEEQGATIAAEAACGVLRAGVALVRQHTHADALAALLDLYAQDAAALVPAP